MVCLARNDHIEIIDTLRLLEPLAAEVRCKFREKNEKECNATISKASRDRLVSSRKALLSKNPWNEDFLNALKAYSALMFCGIHRHGQKFSQKIVGYEHLHKEIDILFDSMRAAFELDYVKHYTLPGTFECVGKHLTAEDLKGTTVLASYSARFCTRPPTLPTSSAVSDYKWRSCCLRKVIANPLGEKDKAYGDLYIMQGQPTESSGAVMTGLLKVGYTTKSSIRRAGKIQGLCDVEVTVHKQQWLTLFAKRVESIVLQDLDSQGKRRPYKCTCGTTHREWFSVDITEARRTIEFWVDWFKENHPYNEEGGWTQRGLKLLLPDDVDAFVSTLDKRPIHANVSSTSAVCKCTPKPSSATQRRSSTEREESVQDEQGVNCAVQKYDELPTPSPDRYDRSLSPSIQDTSSSPRTPTRDSTSSRRRSLRLSESLLETDPGTPPPLSACSSTDSVPRSSKRSTGSLPATPSPCPEPKSSQTFSSQETYVTAYDWSEAEQVIEPLEYNDEEVPKILVANTASKSDDIDCFELDQEAHVVSTTLQRI